MPAALCFAKEIAFFPKVSGQVAANPLTAVRNAFSQILIG